MKRGQVVLALLLAGSLFGFGVSRTLALVPGAIRYFPESSDDDQNNIDIDYNIGTFEYEAVGELYAPSPDNADSYPFPNTLPFQTTVNIQPGAVIGGFMGVYNGSTVNMSGGTVNEILPSWDPNVNYTLPGDSGDTVNVSGGTVTLGITAWGSDNINVTGGSIQNGLVGQFGATISMTGGSTPTVAALGSQTTAFVGGDALAGQVVAGTDNEAVTDQGGKVTVDGSAAIDDAVAAGTGILTLNSGIDDLGGVEADSNATVNMNGTSTLEESLSISGNAVVSFGQMTTSASLLMTGGTAIGSGGGKIAGEVSLSGSANASLNSMEIGTTIVTTGSSVLTLNSCVYDGNGADPGITAQGTSTVTVNGSSLINGDCTSLGQATVNIAGGTISGNIYCSGGTVNITGGVIDGMAESIDGTINYSGGIVLGGVTQNAGLIEAGADSPDDMITGSLNIESLGGVIDIYGTNLQTELVTSKFDGGQYSEYELTGTLADGTEVDGGTFLVANGSGGSFALLPPLPEPGTIGVLVVMGGMLGMRRRRGAGV